MQGAGGDPSLGVKHHNGAWEVEEPMECASIMVEGTLLIDFRVHPPHNVVFHEKGLRTRRQQIQRWGVVLQQAKQGVPIGGYLSAQLMCLWALVQEHTSFGSPKKPLLIKKVKTMCVFRDIAQSCLCVVHKACLHVVSTLCYVSTTTLNHGPV